MKNLKLKYLIILMTVLTTVKSWSHPENSDYFNGVGLGSKIIAKKDINIKPNRIRLGMFRESHGSYYSEPTCWLNFEGSYVDRVITKGTTFVIVAHDPQKDYYQFKLSNSIYTNTELTLSCYLDTWTAESGSIIDSAITIGQARKAMEKYFDLVFPAPVMF